MPTEESLRIIVHTLDKSRKAEVSLPPSMTAAELIKECRKNWMLPDDVDYALRCERLNAQLPDEETLARSGVEGDDVLELVPFLEAGSRSG